MRRLTKRLPDNLGCVPVEGIGWPEIAERLASYEDTGLTPETCKDIKSLCDDYVDAGLDASLILACIAAARAGVSSKSMTEISEAESEGRLIVLPCKVGDTVFVIAFCGEIYTHRDWDTGALECPFEYDCEAEKCDDNSLRVFETTCTGFCVDELDKKLHVFVKGIGLDGGDVVGERVFLTREEAEAALKEA